MEILIYTVAVLVVAVVLFLLVEQPYFLIAPLTFATFYVFNIEIPFPIDSRGLLVLLIFLRLYIFDKENMVLVNDHLFRNKIFLMIIFFLIFELIVPISEGEKFISYLKEILLIIVSVIIGFLGMQNNIGKKSFLIGLFFAGILSSIDLIFTFFTTGELNIIRVIDLLMGNKVIGNHNYPGLLSGVAFLFAYICLSRNIFNKFLMFAVMVFLFIGMLFSTSRSTLGGVIFVFFMINFFERDFRVKIKRIYLSIFILLLLYVGGLFYFQFTGIPNNRFTFQGVFYYRLYSEPLQYFGKSQLSFNPYTGELIEGSMNFRSEKWKKDLLKFFKNDPAHQFFGLGPGGYLEISEKVYNKWNNVKGQYAAHNGYIFILIERGFLGLFLFLAIIITLSFYLLKKSFYSEVQFPFVYLFIAIVFYSIGQNSELTSRFVFMLIGGLIYSAYFERNE
ncbi:MAG: O-antigen ligase family protein [Ignavibacteriae bacterium]|nr:O-antigen ligase family protein [Ignavibacteriota bacterium]